MACSTTDRGKRHDGGHGTGDMEKMKSIDFPSDKYKIIEAFS